MKEALYLVGGSILRKAVLYLVRGNYNEGGGSILREGRSVERGDYSWWRGGDTNFFGTRSHQP